MAKKISLLGFLIAVALLLSYIEHLVPLHTGIPGVKWGIANIVILLSLYRLPSKEIFFIVLVRVITATFFSGTYFSMLFSLSGAFTSLLIMLILYRKHTFSIIGISIAGGVTHNLAQLLAAILLLKTNAFLWYLPILLIAGLTAGTINGIIAIRLLHATK